MTPDNIPEMYRADFLRRMADMQDSSVYEYGSGTESAADSAADTEYTEYSDREDSLADTTQWVRYYDYLMIERQLRLVVELQNSECEVFVLESPVHFAGMRRQDGELVLDMEQPRRMCVYMHNFYTQRSFCRHLHSKIRSLGTLTTPLSLRFALTHPLFASQVQGVVTSTTSSDKQAVLTCNVDRETHSTDSVNVGLVRLNSTEGSMTLVLEPHLLVSMWRDGLVAQLNTVPTSAEVETSIRSL